MASDVASSLTAGSLDSGSGGLGWNPGAIAL